MVHLTHAGTWSPAALSEAAQITDLQVFEVSGRLYLVSSSGAYGELASWEWTGTGLNLRDTHALSGTAGLAAPGGLALFESAGLGAFYSFGGAGQGLAGYRVTATGAIQSLGDQGAGPLTLETVLELHTAGGVRVLGAGRDAGSEGLVAWQGGAAGLSGGVQITVGAGGSGTEVPDMGALRVGGQDYLLTVDPAGNALQAWAVGASGAPVLVDSATPADGLWVNTPVQLETVVMAGTGYAIVGASGSGSLSVVKLGPGGQLWVTDHVIDDRMTRFDDVTVLETVQVGDRVFVLAAGADSGVTLMTLMPDGRLLALDSLASGAGASLEDITALEAVVSMSGEMTVFVAAEGFEGVAALSADLGLLAPVLRGTDGGDRLTGDGRGDLMLGGGGADVLNGAGGDDILDGGSGADTLYGGAGADIFVFAADGAPDVIADFEVGTDRIDLSGLGRVYALEALTFETLPGGVRITFNGEHLDVMSADGRDLSQADFTLETLFDMAHSPVDPLPAAPLHLVGSAGDDLLAGDALNDTVEGAGGADCLVGGAGADVLRADLGDAGFDAASDQVVRLFQASFGRLPGSSGHRAWTERIATGEITGAQAAAGFAASSEFLATYGDCSDAEYITLLFNNVLGRDPAAAGLEAWVQQLEGGMTRAQVLWAFAESPEFSAAMQATALDHGYAALQAEMMDDVYRLFRATLGRDPGAAGLEAWADQLASGVSYLEVVSGFVNSPEFARVYGETSNAEFVDLLFLNVLGRPPAEAGRAAWIEALDGGLSRERMVEAFAQGAEFIQTSHAAMVAFMRSLPDDTLDGGPGDDLLFGGAGADLFIFDATEAGTDQLVGIEAWDTIRIDNAPWSDPADLIAALEQRGDDVVLDMGDAVLVFADTAVTQLQEEMFLLS